MSNCPCYSHTVYLQNLYSLGKRRLLVQVVLDFKSCNLQTETVFDNWDSNLINCRIILLENTIYVSF